MALSNCQDCGREASTRARHCMHCGRPYPASPLGMRVVMLAVGLIAAGIIISVAMSFKSMGRPGMPGPLAPDSFHMEKSR